MSNNQSSVSSIEDKEPLPETSSAANASRKALRDMIAKKRREIPKNQVSDEAFDVVEDPFEIAESSIPNIRKQTAFVHEDAFNDHLCFWDPDYPENPDRIGCIYTRGEELNIWKRCVKLEVEECKDEDILSVHSRHMMRQLNEICDLSDEDMEIAAEKFDSIYFNQLTPAVAKLCVSAVLKLMREVAVGNYHNGFALVRPPGHHAMMDKYCGYCIYNNVAIAANVAIKEGLATKVLIVDFDVHHGQGTQQMFYDRNDVLYFSIHRYEHGTFWPNLRESDSDYIGRARGKGYNINVPLNEVGLGDAEYLAILHSILIPVAYEFNPDLVLISAGYDAAMGCMEGEMMVTPAFYGHLITSLSGIAGGKIVACLEGGYFPPSLAEGAMMTIKALLGDPCGILDPVTQLHPTIIDTINNVKFHLKGLWRCFDFVETFKFVNNKEGPTDTITFAEDQHTVVWKYCGEVPKGPFPTRNCYPVASEDHKLELTSKIELLRMQYGRKIVGPVGYVYDDHLLKHETEEKGKNWAERPARLTVINNFILRFGLKKRLKKLEIVDYQDIVNVMTNTHDSKYLTEILDETNLPMSKPDFFFNEYTSSCIKLCVNAILTLTNEIFESESVSSGVAIIRPPGHHAHHDKSSGFCYVNNAVIAANHMINKYKMKRVLIVDFDVHHGDGTQELLYDRKDVMYISIHRFDDAKFFPCKDNANYHFYGKGVGEGYNVNVPLNGLKMGNAEYLHIFHHVVLPLAYSFAPEAVIVSAGFDAAVGDILGGYIVSPEMYGHFIQLLKPLAGGKLLLLLEGGYQIDSTAFSMCMCIKALLGDPIPMPKLLVMRREAVDSVRNVIDVQRKFWPVLTLHKSICNVVFTSDEKWLMQNLLVRFKRALLSNPSGRSIKIKEITQEVEKCVSAILKRNAP